MKVLNNTAEIKESCNCRNKKNFSLDGKCLTPSVIYEVKITSKQPNYKEKNYIGATGTDLITTKFFNLKQYENNPEPSKEYWTMKCNHFTPKATWRIKKAHL